MLEVGGSFNRHDGVFTASVSGVYVFSWSTYSCYNGDIVSELIVNSERRGGIRSDNLTVREDHSSSGCLVVDLSQGDIVFIFYTPNKFLNWINNQLPWILRVFIQWMVFEVPTKVILRSLVYLCFSSLRKIFFFVKRATVLFRINFKGDIKKKFHEKQKGNLCKHKRKGNRGLHCKLFFNFNTFTSRCLLQHISFS